MFFAEPKIAIDIMPDLASEATKFIFEKLIVYDGSKFLERTREK